MSDDAGRAALQIAGIVVGGLFGGPVGASIGGSLGALAGSALFPLDPVRGPRLDSFNLTASEYGVALPVAWGSVRLPVNIIWMSDVREVGTTQDVGGKGGGPEVTTYRYYADVACAICAGPILGVRRIWADSQLLLDGSSTATAASLLNSQQNVQFNITVYAGTESQLPDATIEAALGVGSAPAYRGTAYMVIRGLDLSNWGNRVPIMSVEVVTAGGTTAARQLFVAATSPITYRNGGSGVIPRITSIDGAIRISNYADTQVRVHALGGAFAGIEPRAPADAAFYPTVDGDAQLITALYDGGRLYCRRATSLAGIHLYVRTAGNSVIDLLPGLDWYTGVGNHALPISVAGCVDRAHILVLLGQNVFAAPTSYRLYRYNGSAVLTLVDSGTTSGLAWGALGNAGTDPSASIAEQRAAMMLESDLVHLWIITTGGAPTGTVYYATRSAGGLTATLFFSGAMPANDSAPSLYADDGICFAVSNATVAAFTRGASLAQNTETLQNVVSGVCSLAGLSAGEIDVAALSGNVRGFAIDKRMSARLALEPLGVAFGFDGVESDGKVKFVPRGLPVVATLSAADLGATAGDMAPLLESTRAQENELPEAVAVTYPSAASDYQNLTQRERRLAAWATEETAVMVPVVLSDNEAHAIARRMLYQPWAQRTARRFSTTEALLKLEPTDRVTLAIESQPTVMITAVTDDNGVRRFEAVDDDATVYTQPGVGASGPAAQNSVIAATPTSLRLLDIPLLRDADEGAGFYAGACGFDAGWPGAQLYRSADGGTSFAPLQSLVQTATLGVAASMLRNYAGPNTFDENNWVDVRITQGELSSVTSAAVFDGGNFAFLGGEIIAFRGAVLQSPGLYRLSGLLRGRRGTEQFIGAHAVGEPFVLLGPGLYRLPLATTELNQARQYKAVTFGRTVAQTIGIDATNTGASLKPLAPVHLAVMRASHSNDLRLQWVRRGRIDAQWRNGVDVPLGEVGELYDVEILSLDGLTVLRTFSSLAAQNVTYTNANVVSDYGPAPTSLRFRVFQRSAVVARGFPAEALLAIPGAVATFTVALLHFDGTNGSTTFTDDFGNAWTRTGSATISTAQSQFGGASLTLNGTTDYLSSADGARWDFGSGDFTIEAWVRPAVTNATQAIFGKQRGAAAFGEYLFYIAATNQLAFAATTGGEQTTSFNLVWHIQGTNVFTANQWAHVAVTRQGTTFRLFHNGNLVGTTATASGAITNGTSSATIGAGKDNGSSLFNGFIDELRVTKGLARYTAPFTPTGPFTE